MIDEVWKEVETTEIQDSVWCIQDVKHIITLTVLLVRVLCGEMQSMIITEKIDSCTAMLSTPPLYLEGPGFISQPKVKVS